MILYVNLSVCYHQEILSKSTESTFPECECCWWPIGLVQVNFDEVTIDALPPHSVVLGLISFQDCELIQGRWAMMAAVRCLVAEHVTEVQDADWVETTGGLAVTPACCCLQNVCTGPIEYLTLR